MAKKATKILRTVLVTGDGAGLGLEHYAAAPNSTRPAYRVVSGDLLELTKELTTALARAETRGKHRSLHFVAFDLGKIDEIPGLVQEAAPGIRSRSTGSSTMPRSASMARCR